MIWAVLVIAGLLLAWPGFHKGFYPMFATLFCLMFAVYIGILAAPWIVGQSPGMEQEPYYAATIVLGTVLTIFVLLWGVAYFGFLRGHEGYFPAFIDRFGGGLCGFLLGYILMGLLLLLVCMTPLLVSEALPEFIQHEAVVRYAAPPILKACNFIAAYSLECFYGDVEKTLEFLLITQKP